MEHSPKRNKTEVVEYAPKQYLYHMKPKKMSGNELRPLMHFKDIDPELYEVYTKKYKNRLHVMENLVQGLDCAWNDVVHLSPVHPKEIVEILKSAGYKPEEMEFYQIDPETLDPNLTTIYLYSTFEKGPIDQNDFAPYDPKNISQYSVIRDEVLTHHKKEKKAGVENPILFVGIPHVLHKGPIDIRECEVIRV